MTANYSRLMFAFIAAFSLMVGAVSCGGGGGQNGAESPSGESDAGSDARDDTGESDADSGTCEPRTCEDVSSGCGIHDDGCGGELDCGTCTCSSDSVDADCPSQPCMEAVGCNSSGECQYAPTACAGEVCDECADGSCTAEQLRSCGPGDACPVAFCDPAPQTDENGQVTYQNTCRSEAVVSCGTCGLGAFQCSGDGSYECVEPPLVGDGGLNANCESAVRPTFIYLDPGFEGEDSDGSKQAPFTTIADAVDEIQSVDARVLVIGGSPEIALPGVASGRDEAPNYGFRVTEGVSILGGFSAAPEFVRDRQERPTIYAAEANIALEAEDIEASTIISGIDFENTRGTIEDTSYGAVIRRSPGLKLIDVHIQANSPDGAGELITFADPMPASTSNRSPDQPPIEDNDINNGFGGLFVASDTCDSYDLHVQSDEFSNSYANLSLSCPIFDDRAKQFYGEDTAEDFLGIYPPRAGTGGQSAFWHSDIGSGEAGFDPLHGQADAQGGYWVWNSGYEYLEAEDASPYEGAERFAAAGDSGSADGQLDDDRLWHELGDGHYGAVGYPGPPGGGGGGQKAKFLESVSVDDYGINGDACASGLAGEHGGSGGCGGLGGRGGSGGSWVIGIFLDESAQTEFSDVSVETGDAAHGQYGSAGGRPAPGAAGGQPRYYAVDYTVNNDDMTVIQLSNPGGDGAAGQWGGHGGHGAGGSTVGILQVGTEVEEFDGVGVELGQPGVSPAAVDPYAPQDMPAPQAPGQGAAHEVYTHP